MRSQQDMRRSLGLAVALAIGIPSLTQAVEIEGILPAAFDQPRINAFVRLPGSTAPLIADFGVGITFNITAFYDTGASGVLISAQTAEFLGVNASNPGIPLEQVGGTNVVFSDVGVGGSQDFNVSVPLEIGLAPYNQFLGDQLDDITTYNTLYNTQFAGIRAQIGQPLTDVDNPLLEGLDVFGMPTMAGKHVVMDNRGINRYINEVIAGNPDSTDYFDTMRTYVYDPGTPYNPAETDSNPGIPETDLHVQMSYASFDRFTTITPAGANGPTLRNNPFIGPNPVAKLDDPNFDDGTPAIELSFEGASAEGTFLFDTGAAASIISQDLAERVGVKYADGTFGTDSPVLQTLDGGSVPNQFSLTIGGIGGTTVLSGFFLDEMLIRTIEGGAYDGDPNHLLFIGAPVLVGDITVYDPVADQELTLEGILGMNFLTSSAFISAGGPLGIEIEALASGAFDWLVFDEPNGQIGFKLITVPEPASLSLLAMGAGIVLRRRRSL